MGELFFCWVEWNLWGEWNSKSDEVKTKLNFEDVGSSLKLAIVQEYSYNIIMTNLWADLLPVIWHVKF